MKSPPWGVSDFLKDTFFMELSRNASSPFDVLVKKAVEGDSKAFREIYDAISGKIYSMCLRYAGNENDANDFFQEDYVGK